MSAPITEAHIDLVRYVLDAEWYGTNVEKKFAQEIADSEARAVASAVTMLTCTHHNDQQRADCPVCVVAKLRAEVEAQCLLNGKGAEREADLLGRLERAEREVERLKADGAASAFVAMACRASRAETDRNNLRADLDAIKAIRDEEKARAARAEAELKAEQDNSAINEIELRVSRAIVSKIWVQLGSPTYEQLKGRSIYDLIDEMKAELTAERAKARALRSACERLRDCDWVITLPDRMDAVRDIARAAIDAAMKEEGK